MLTSKSGGFTSLAVVVAIGAVAGTVIGIRYNDQRTAIAQVEVEKSRAEVQRKLASGLNLIQSLIAAKHIVPTGDSNLVRFVRTPDSSSVAGCEGFGSNDAYNAGLWRYVPRNGASLPRIELDLCNGASGQSGCANNSGESMMLEFSSRDAGASTSSFDIINGRFLYTGPSSGRIKNATFPVRMEIATTSPLTPSGGKCAIFIGTRGSHGSNITGSALGGFPNWGNAWPHYNWWWMYIPHPPNLATSITWQGTPLTSRFTSVPSSAPIMTGHFAPCNRMYEFHWSCINDYRPVPLVRNHCGEPVLSFTNHTPGSGTCSADCRCYLGVQSSPLVVDFKGQGVKFSRGLMDQVKFDMGSGPDLLTPWVTNGSDVAFVALDVNGNGIIDSVHELFGDRTILPDGKERDNGFLALAYYDANQDGVIDLADPIFNQLFIWNDKNVDAKTDEGELRRVSDAGLKQFSLQAIEKESNSDGRGNRALFSSTVMTSDGRLLDVHDVYFGGSGPKARTPGQELVSTINRDAIEFEERKSWLR